MRETETTAAAPPERKRRGPVRWALRIIGWLLLALVGVVVWIVAVVQAENHLGSGASMLVAVAPLLVGILRRPGADTPPDAAPTIGRGDSGGRACGRHASGGRRDVHDGGGVSRISRGNAGIPDRRDVGMAPARRRELG